jgi:hypothetical protein
VIDEKVSVERLRGCVICAVLILVINEGRW